MSRCNVCMDVYHPDYIVYQEIRGDIVKVCAWCKTDKKTLTVLDDDGKVMEVVEKKQASTNYKKWLGEIINKPDIAKLIDKGQK